MSGDGYVVVGRVVKTHGLKGEVSVALATGASLDRLVGATVWLVPPSHTLRSAVVCALRQGPKGPLLSLSAVDSIDVARTLVGKDILVDAAAFPVVSEVPEDHGREGYHVLDETRGDLGRITETIVTGANDVWVVNGPWGEVLIPVIDDVVVSADEGAKIIRVRLLPGLLPDREGEACDR